MLLLDGIETETGDGKEGCPTYIKGGERMPLSVRRSIYKIPEYSLTGDLLAYIKCPLQYRFYNRNSLPPSKPVQLWFGEFIHGVLEEAYLEWRDNNRRTSPWQWIPEIREIELRIHRRLQAKGLNPPARVFCPYDESFNRRGLCPDANHPHKLIASERAVAAINTWGPHLFPLIDQYEVKLKGLRDMPDHDKNRDRSNYYGITGVIDVISSVNLRNAPHGNLILHYLNENEEIRRIIDRAGEEKFEIIVDYKGMRRPPTHSDEWQAHEWQVLSYAWLRSHQPDARPVVAGILFYINELVPTSADIQELQQELRGGNTDILPTQQELNSILRWNSGDQNPLSTVYMERRSTRIIPISQQRIQDALDNFDSVVRQIENRIIQEMRGEQISNIWEGRPQQRTCDACDFKTFCRYAHRQIRRYRPTVP